MKSKTTKIAITTIISIFVAPPLSIPTAIAADPCSDTTIPPSVRESVYHCGSTSGNAINSAGNAVSVILSTIIGALGIVAVIFIVMGGVQYLTSSGDPGKVKKAKDTILYACIGLVICALAFAITQFAINAINGT